MNVDLASQARVLRGYLAEPNRLDDPIVLVDADEAGSQPAFRIFGVKGTVWFPIGFVIFWYASLLLFPYTYEGLSPFEDFILNCLLWLSLGILFRLPKLAGDVQGNSLAAGSAPAVRTI